MTPARLRAAVRVALDALGDTPDGIAGALALRHITGTRSLTACPIARYLVAQLPELGDRTLHVLGNGMVLVQRDPGPEWRWLMEHVAPPHSVRVFVEMFDDGQYPDLRDES